MNSPTMTDPNTQVFALADLAARINAEHAAVESSARSTLEHARRAGELLLQARATCKHGDWLAFLSTSVKFHQRTAQRYMRIAENWAQLQAKSDTVSHLGFAAAMDLLAGKDEEKPARPAPVKAPALLAWSDVEDEDDDDATPEDLTAEALRGLSPEKRIEVLTEARRQDMEEAPLHESLPEEERRHQKVNNHIAVARNKSEHLDGGAPVVEQLDLAAEVSHLVGKDQPDQMRILGCLGYLKAARAKIYPVAAATIVVDAIDNAIIEAESLR